MRMKTVGVGLKNARDFWRVYLGIQNSLSPKNLRLTPNELEMMSYILCQDMYKNPFRKMGRQRMKDALKITEATVASNRRSLVEKKWIDSDGLVRSNIREIAKIWTEQDDLEIPIRLYVRKQGTGE